MNLRSGCHSLSETGPPARVLWFPAWRDPGGTSLGTFSERWTQAPSVLEVPVLLPSPSPPFLRSVAPAREKPDSPHSVFKITLIIPPLKVIFKPFVTNFFFFFLMQREGIKAPDFLLEKLRFLTHNLGFYFFSNVWAPGLHEVLLFHLIQVLG